MSTAFFYLYVRSVLWQYCLRSTILLFHVTICRISVCAAARLHIISAYWLNVLFKWNQILWVAWWHYQMETFSALLTIFREIHQSHTQTPHKDQWRGALKCSLISAWTNGWVNNGGVGDLRRHRANAQGDRDKPVGNGILVPMTTWKADLELLCPILMYGILHIETLVVK